MPTLDDKQRRLIKAWLGLASVDEYSCYMFAWVAFNALCYALFANVASRRRPNLSDERGLNGLAGEVRTEGRIEVRNDGRVSIRLDSPGKIRIDIRERYTEDRIFSAFASKFQPEYLQWLEAPLFSAKLDKLLTTIRRPRGDYVINMLHVHEHSHKRDLEDMVGRNIVAAITNRADLGQLIAVVYQIRNNMFHGEKIPGDLNDDRIVRVARPVLEDVVKRAYETTAE